ncbi:GAF and ANTAR domain-containing protein [Lentzea sp. NPDC004782]|uniref:GAF and ANTAR domain-containing protein n=1 Tax=Lentzea sp. NPDC004782 TaxID=3154458 RepID=UPI0033BF7378
MTVSDQRAREAFVALSSTLVDDFDIIDFLDRLVDCCVEVLGVTAAGLLLVDHRGTLNMVAASTEQAMIAELFQLQNHEGPCLDAYHGGEAVLCADLAGASDRWPNFVRAAAGAGFAAVHALPMRLRGTVIGGLNLFSARQGALDPATVEVGQALANVATVAILRQRSARHGDVVVEELQAALDSRILVEQAKGVLAERLNTTVEKSFDLLRRYAHASSVPLAELAAAVVDGSADVALIAATDVRPA